MPQPIRQGISYMVVARAVSMGLEFGSSVLLTRGLGVEQYGLYGVFFTGATTAAAVVDMGVNSAVSKYTAEHDSQAEPGGTYSILASALILHGVLTLASWGLFLLAGKTAISLWFDGDAWLYFLVALSLPMLLFLGDLLGALYGLSELKFVAARMVLQSGILVILNLLLIWWLGLGVRIAAGIYVGTVFILLLWLVRFFGTLVRTDRLRINRTLQIRRIVDFSLPLAGIYPIDSVIRMAPVLLVKAFGGGEANINQQVGFLSLAVLLGSAVQNLVLVVLTTGYGYMARWYAQGRLEQLRKYLILAQVSILVAYGGVILLSVIGLPKFIELVYGGEYLGATNYILLALVVNAIRSMTVLYRSLLYSMALTPVVLRSSLIELIVYGALVTVLYSVQTGTLDWGIALLVVAAGAGSVKVAILMAASLRSLRLAMREASA